MKHLHHAFLTFIKLLAGLLVLAVLLLEIAPRVLIRVDKTVVPGSAAWMKELSDDLPLSRISIPGSHNTAAENVSAAFLTRCQDLSIREQLEAGWRLLDIRVGGFVIDGKKTLTLYHDFLPCREGRFLLNRRLTLESVMNDCIGFLKANPSETVLLIVKQETGDESIAEIQGLLKDLTDAQREYWLLTDTMPTLGEARGKLVLLRRYPDDAGLGTEAGIRIDWKDQGSRNDTTLAAEKNERDGLTFFVQDHYHYTTEEKWTSFRNTLKESPSLMEQGPVLNYLSTVGSRSYGIPAVFAFPLNKKLAEESFSEGIPGWNILDYGSAALAEKIWKTNFQ